MADFDTAAALSLEVPADQLRHVRQQIEGELGSVPVRTDGGTASAQMAGGGVAITDVDGTTRGQLAGILDANREHLSVSQSVSGSLASIESAVGEGGLPAGGGGDGEMDDELYRSRRGRRIFRWSRKRTEHTETMVELLTEIEDDGLGGGGGGGLLGGGGGGGLGALAGGGIGGILGRGLGGLGAGALVKGLAGRATMGAVAGGTVGTLGILGAIQGGKALDDISEGGKGYEGAFDFGQMFQQNQPGTANFIEGIFTSESNPFFAAGQAEGNGGNGFNAFFDAIRPGGDRGGGGGGDEPPPQASEEQIQRLEEHDDPGITVNYDPTIEVSSEATPDEVVTEVERVQREAMEELKREVEDNFVSKDDINGPQSTSGRTRPGRNY